MKNIGNISERYYSELDEIPLYNWKKCIEGKFYFIRKKAPSKKRLKNDVESDIIAFYQLYNKYIEVYGLGDKMEEFLDLKKRVIELRILFIQTGNKALLTQIEIDVATMQKIDPSKHEGMSIGEILVHISKWMGTWINDKDLTVAGFQDLIKQYEQSNKKK